MKGNLNNVLVALREAPELAELCAFNEMAGMVFHLPEQRPWRDVDTTAVMAWLQAQGMQGVRITTVDQGIDMVARERGYHPIRQMLDALRWDGEKRIEAWLHRYLGAEDSNYTRVIGALFLIGMVARVLRPGCRMDYVIVLEGEQGILKSTACAVLAGEWFDDHLPDLRDHRLASQHLRGKWLIEIAELAAIDKAEGEVLKSFITRSHERYLPRFAHHEVIEPRSCTFIGTTKQAVYLHDETGGRRFWPLRCGRIDIEALRRDRNQLLAEALARFQAGEPWWPPREFERQHIAPQQAARFERDAWQDRIEDWLHETHPVRITVGQVGADALFLDHAKLGTREQRRISRILEKLGWQRQPERNARWWVPPRSH